MEKLKNEKDPFKLYIKFVEKNNPTKEMNELFQEIIKYNEIDCKVMSEIVNWMRVFL